MSLLERDGKVVRRRALRVPALRQPLDVRAEAHGAVKRDRRVRAEPGANLLEPRCDGCRLSQLSHAEPSGRRRREKS